MSRRTTEYTFRALFSAGVAKYSEKLLFVDENFSKSYKDFYEDMQKLSAYLVRNGYAGKKIGIFAHNSYDWLVIFAAVVMNVGVVVPLDSELPAKELALSVKRVKLDLVFYDDFTQNKIKDIGRNVQTKHVNEIGQIVATETGIFVETKLRECEYVALFFTSGTTSQSKIVMLSEKNLVFCAYVSAAAFKLKAKDRYYTMLPLHHTFALMCAVLVPMTSGCSICFSKNIKNMQKELCFYKPTALVVVPRLLEYLASGIQKSIDKSDKAKMVNLAKRLGETLAKARIDVRKLLFRDIHAKFGGKIRMIACGGAELDRRIFEYLDGLGFDIYQGYGLTESSPVLTIRGMFVKDKHGVGRSLDGVELRVDNPNSDGVGEIVARAPQVMLGYYHDVAATQEVLKNGWLHTGDLGYIRESGSLEIVGRKKNVIIASNGKNIYPEELETLINYSGLVKESVVSGIKKSSSIQILATIVPEDKVAKNKNLDKEISKLVGEINADLPAYKRINKYIIQYKEFEKTTTLKIKRRRSEHA